MSVWYVLKGKDFCFGVNNEQYRCEMGYCCGETECCTYYYELWCKSPFYPPAFQYLSSYPSLVIQKLDSVTDVGQELFSTHTEGRNSTQSQLFRSHNCGFQCGSCTG